MRKHRAIRTWQPAMRRTWKNPEYTAEHWFQRRVLLALRGEGMNLLGQLAAPAQLRGRVLQPANLAATRAPESEHRCPGRDPTPCRCGRDTPPPKRRTARR